MKFGVGEQEKVVGGVYRSTIRKDIDRVAIEVCSHLHFLQYYYAFVVDCTYLCFFIFSYPGSSHFS